MSLLATPRSLATESQNLNHPRRISHNLYLLPSNSVSTRLNSAARTDRSSETIESANCGLREAGVKTDRRLTVIGRLTRWR